MKGLVVYDSKFGNTEKVAHAIATALGPEESVRTVKVDAVAAEDLKDLDVIVVGSPVHAWRPTKEMQAFLGGLQPNALSGVQAAAFDTRYRGKPLVFCGTVGSLPVKVDGRPGESKKALPGDIIVMTGGRIGADGIHGATFSSAALDESSPVQAATRPSSFLTRPAGYERLNSYFCTPPPGWTTFERIRGAARCCGGSASRRTRTECT